MYQAVINILSYVCLLYLLNLKKPTLCSPEKYLQVC